MSSAPGWVVERLTDFELIQVKQPMEWGLATLHSRVGVLIESMESAARESL